MPTNISGDTGVSQVQNGAVLFDDMPAGSVIQVANFTTGAMATGTTILPNDDTIPQITEGTQFMSLAFTAKKANSVLRIDICVQISGSINGTLSTAIFKDSAVNSIGVQGLYNAAGTPTTYSFSLFIAAVDTSLHTYTVRCGLPAAGTITFNGYTGARIFGGSLASSITITEISQ